MIVLVTTVIIGDATEADGDEDRQVRPQGDAVPAILACVPIRVDWRRGSVICIECERRTDLRAASLDLIRIQDGRSGSAAGHLPACLRTARNSPVARFRTILTGEA